MRFAPATLRHLLTVLILLALALAARIRNTMLDFNSLLTSYLADDAFYYFKIATNVATQHRITYDGEQLSNGFHPLWLALITPFYTAANDGVDFVDRIQWIMLCLNLLTVIVLYISLLRLRASMWLAGVVTAVFCVHSTFVDLQMNGLETSLNTIMLLLLFNAFLTICLQPFSAAGRYIYLGIVAGAAFLARTDNGITILLLFCFLAWKTRSSAVADWPRLVMSGAVALLLVAPWLLWNWINFDSIVQGSGKIETIYWAEPSPSLASTAYSLLLLPERVYGDMQQFVRLFIAPDSSPALITVLFIVAWILLMLLLSRGNKSPRLQALAVFCISVFAVFCYHAGLRNFVRTWYLVPVGLMALLSVAALFIWLQEQEWDVRWQKSIALSSHVLLVCWLLSIVLLYPPTKLPGKAIERSPNFEVADWINSNTPQDAVIGSMNSGILSYLVHRKVVNLDGVVDARSMRAHWEKRRAAYIHERGIRYLVDNDGARQFFCSDNPLHICQPVFTFGDPRNTNKVVQIIDK